MRSSDFGNKGMLPARQARQAMKHFFPVELPFFRLCTGVLLLLGAVERLGPNANATVCSSALFAWAARFLASRQLLFVALLGTRKGSSHVKPSKSFKPKKWNFSPAKNIRDQDHYASKDSGFGLHKCHCSAERRETPMPPREDFDDEPTAYPAEAASAALALAAAAAILIPGDSFASPEPLTVETLL